jgi:hypothetical protein
MHTPLSLCLRQWFSTGAVAHFTYLQELTVLGQQLLGDGGTTAAPQGGASAAAASTSSSIPADVLVAAARQHLMSAETAQLHVRHVVLLLADYQQLAASYYAHMMLSK